MRRKPLNTAARSKLSKYAKPLAQLAILLADAGSRIERRFWKIRLMNAIAPHLAGNSETTLNQSLDYLYETHLQAYDELAFALETSVESPGLNPKSDVLLIAAPILAWSTYNIPSGRIEPARMEEIYTLFRNQLLAAEAEIVLTDLLFSPDQLPPSYNAAAELAKQLGEAAVNQQRITVDHSTLPVTQHFLSDVRYLIGCISTPKDGAMFKWQEETIGGSGPMLNREEVQAQWGKHALLVFQKLLPGCTIEMVLPNGLYSACRNAEKEARAYALKASVSFLETAINARPTDLHASVGAFVDRGEIEEYRIGITVGGSDEVVHGVVWTLLGEEFGNEPDPMFEKDLSTEPENPVVRNRIKALLNEVGIFNVHMLEERFPLEYCEDCGAPLYPNPEGELMHAELPEDAEINQIQLH
jgi:hypothetical protein